MPTTTDFYVNYLRRKATSLPIPEEFYNKCHTPSGPAGGQFCSGSDIADFTGMDLVDKNTADKLRRTATVISKVHDLPQSYPKAYVEFDITNRLGTADGSYSADGDQITLSQVPTGAEITFVHEFGHHITLAEEGNYSLDQFQDRIDRTPTLRAWRDAVEATPTYENLRKRFLDDGEDYAGYLKDERELFARSYAQYIARRSRDATLNDQLERNRSKNRDFQWPDDEFTPIADALDNHFRQRQHITAAATAPALHLEGQHDQASHGRRGGGDFTGWEDAQSKAVQDIPNGESWLRPDGMSIPVKQHSDVTPSHSREGYLQLTEKAKVIRVVADAWAVDVEQFEISTKEQREALASAVATGTRNFTLEANDISRTHHSANLFMPEYDEVIRELEKANRALRNKNRDDFANPCHSPEDGRFCETEGTASKRDISVRPHKDEDQEFDRVAQLEKHYGRKEQAPEMGGISWAFGGYSPVITEAARDVLQGEPYDPYDRYTNYGKDGYDVAETILTTIENESSDVILYSGHHRSRDEIEAIIEEGVSFPLVATSPDVRLADIYAGNGSKSVPAAIFEFPRGSQAGFYQANEHIASGTYRVTGYEWNADQTKISIQLEQTERSVAPPKRDLYEEEE